MLNDAPAEKPGPAEHGDGALVREHHADPLLIEFCPLNGGGVRLPGTGFD
jgi:hypothetical protein